MLLRVAALLLILLITPSHVSAATENLDELISRISRYGTNTWGKAYLENDSYVWNSESVMYLDLGSDKEMWVLNRAPNKDQYYSKEYGARAWSADGSTIGFWMHQDDRGTDNPNSPSDTGGISYRRWLVKSDGTYLKCAEGYGHEHIPWDAWGWANTENAYYAFGSENTPGQPDDAEEYELVKNVVDAENIVTGSVILNTDTATGGDDDKGWTGDRKQLLKMAIDPEDDYLLVYTAGQHDFGRGSSRGIMRIDLNQGVSPTIDTYFGTKRDITEYGNHSQSNEYRFHGGGGIGWGVDREYVMAHYTGSENIFFKLLATGGTDTDGGPKWEAWDGDSYGANEVYPICKGSAGTDPPGPFASYWNHVAFDAWSKFHIGGGGSDDPEGAGCFVSETDPPFTRAFTNTGDPTTSEGYVHHNCYDGKHHVWGGWSDYVGYFRQCSYNNFLSGRRINFDTETVDDQEDIFHPHHVENGYTDLPRPSQSPDGTKIAFSHTILQTAQQGINVAYAVIHFPYPPEITQASSSSGTITIRFDWRLDQANPRGYTTRGYPNEATDDPPPPRETKKFRLWRSPDNSSWIPIDTVDANLFTKYSFVTNGWAGGQTSYWEISNAPGDGTWYYAVTSNEWSGLESRSLSNTWKVILSGGVITNGGGAGEEESVYPTNPGADGDFYTSFSASYPELIRYYNIYAQDVTDPSAIQQDRIASLSTGNWSGSTCSWVDWLGNTGGTTQYVVTALDTQGNESATNYVTNQSVAHKESPATADGQYTVKWDNMPQAAVVTAALTGTLADGATEAQIVAGSETLIVTLTGDTWVATFGDDNQITTDFIAGLDSGGAEAAGWDAEVKGNMVFGDVARTNDTTATITLQAEASYNPTANETITLTIPASSLTGAAQVVATPTFEITATSDPAAALTGTLSDNATEAQIVVGTETLIITLTNDTWVAAGATFDAIRQDIIDGMDSAQSEATGWNAEVRDKEVVGAVVRTNATTVTITLSAQAAYDISANENITMTVPASALVTSGSPVVATPDFAIIFFDTSTEEIVGMTLQ